MAATCWRIFSASSLFPRPSWYGIWASNLVTFLRSFLRKVRGEDKINEWTDLVQEHRRCFRRRRANADAEISVQTRNLVPIFERRELHLAALARSNHLLVKYDFVADLALWLAHDDVVLVYVCCFENFAFVRRKDLILWRGEECDNQFNKILKVQEPFVLQNKTSRRRLKAAWLGVIRRFVPRSRKNTEDRIWSPLDIPHDWTFSHECQQEALNGERLGILVGKSIQFWPFTPCILLHYHSDSLVYCLKFSVIVVEGIRILWTCQS